VTCPQYLDGNGNLRPEAAKLGGGSEKRFYWVYILQPYVKNYDLFKCPSSPDAFTPTSGGAPDCEAPGCSGLAYGGQNSYGHNDAWLSPAGNFATGGQPSSVGLAAIDRPASIILVTDATYYGVVPDVTNESGLVDKNKYSDAMLTALTAFTDAQGAQYKSYWKNIGNSKWSYNGGLTDAATALATGPTRHQAKVNCQFSDGHVKAMDYKYVITDFCSWSTGADGAGLQCN